MPQPINAETVVAAVGGLMAWAGVGLGLAGVACSRRGPAAQAFGLGVAALLLVAPGLALTWGVAGLGRPAMAFWSAVLLTWAVFAALVLSRATAARTGTDRRAAGRTEPEDA